MNYGILHNRRPAKRGDGTDAHHPLLNDVRLREMAKQMGLEPKDFGKEAVELWKTLDKMAVEDPTAYQNFISDQLKDGPPLRDDGAGTKGGTAPHALKAFNPRPGYVVKCAMMGPVKQQMVELKLFLNLCFHEIVDLPKNPNSSREVSRDTRAVPTTNNLQIPLVIGALREIKDFHGAPCRAIDVVFHPWVFERCEWDAKFKWDIMALAISWVQQDAKVTLTSPVGKFIKSLYKGGVTVGNEIITARFPIEPEQQQTRTLDVKLHTSDDQDDDAGKMELKTERPASKPPVEKIAMASPSDLLKKMSLDETDDNKKTEFLIAPAGQHSKPASTTPSATATPTAAMPEVKAKPTKKMIEVVEPKQDNQAEDGKPKPTKKKSEVVKKGFLNAAKKPLYPNGSGEGRPASAYVNLLSRSKIVDLGAVEQQKKQQQDDAQRQRDELASQIGMKPSSANALASQPSNSGERDHGDYEFERLCMEADPDLAPSNNGTRASDPASQALFGEHMEEFARFLSSKP